MLGTLAHALGVLARAVPSQPANIGCPIALPRAAALLLALRGWEPRLHGVAVRHQTLFDRNPS